MVDLAVLEAAAERRVGSSPTWGTKYYDNIPNAKKQWHRPDRVRAFYCISLGDISISLVENAPSGKTQ